MKFFYGYLILLGVASLTCTTAQDNSYSESECDHAILRAANLLSSWTYPCNGILPHYDKANQVTLGMSLTKLRGLDLFKGTIQMNVWMNLGWSDPRLAWIAAECGNANITKLHLPPSEIWVPDITLFNSNSPSESLMSGVSAIAYADGSVLYIPPMHLEATCTMDLTDYPYDQHNCSLKWGSWAYDASLITIDSLSDSIDLSETFDHPIWDIINTKATKHTDFYSCCPGETFEDVTFSLVVRRRETHGRIASSVVTAWLILIVFLISPSSAGVRIVFAGSVLIALVVLSAALSAEVPAYSTTKLGRFLIVGMLILALVSVVNGLIYRFYPKEKPGQLIEGDGSSPPRVLLIIDIGAFLSTAIILGISTGALFV
ncbi:neuronal acetylcholine receptor subunit alpha-2-like isoform X2 [Strongylocentrotus purpuratus]|uniref:Neurotransmitter-gated ion-channel ligand-binding domain-containing protein n=1 Tax=Strongylocentrotus purpuratus TaxID=7668 RepID=A0A7M7NVR7_STRPU|nr:neuronal acetylcholine receptor subunit alpha-2-like isoform X2 [Strongylocentrotus purpuratus]